MAVIPRPYREPKKGPPPATPKERALTAWRGVDLGPIEKIQARPARPAAAIVPEALAKWGLARKLSEAEVMKVWNNQIDPEIAAHAQPTGWFKRTLFVTVDSSAWLSEIVRYRSHEIKERLRNSFGPNIIEKISFRLG